MLLKRQVMGFAFAPLPVVLPFTLLFGFILLDRPNDSASVFEAWIELVIVSYGAALLVCVPVHLTLHQLRRRGLRDYLFLTTLAVVAAVIGGELIRVLVPPSSEANPFGLKLASRAGVAATLGIEALALTGSWIFWRTAINAPDERATGFGAAPEK